MQIKECMKTDVKTCNEYENVANAVKKMAENNIGSLIVVKENKPIGIFTERDLVKRVVALGKDPSEVRVGDVMTRELITINAKESVGNAYHIFVKEKVRHVPVIDEEQLLGIVSQKDVAAVIDQQFYGLYASKGDLSGYY